MTLSPSNREFIKALPIGLAAFALTVALAWPLRFEGQMIWTALAAAF